MGQRLLFWVCMYVGYKRQFGRLQNKDDNAPMDAVCRSVNTRTAVYPHDFSLSVAIFTTETGGVFSNDLLPRSQSSPWFDVSRFVSPTRSSRSLMTSSAAGVTSLSESICLCVTSCKECVAMRIIVHSSE